jgi:hypothetical protein
MARKQKKRASEVPIDSHVRVERRVADITVRELVQLLTLVPGVNAPGLQAARAKDDVDSVGSAPAPVTPEMKVVDLTVGQLLRRLTTGRW